MKISLEFLISRCLLWYLIRTSSTAIVVPIGGPITTVDEEDISCINGADDACVGKSSLSWIKWSSSSQGMAACCESSKILLFACCEECSSIKLNGLLFGISSAILRIKKILQESVVKGVIYSILLPHMGFFNAWSTHCFLVIFFHFICVHVNEMSSFSLIYFRYKKMKSIASYLYKSWILIYDRDTFLRLGKFESTTATRIFCKL